MKDWEKDTIGIDFVHEALAVLLERGFDAESLLNAAGISPMLLKAPQARVSAANYGQLWSLIAKQLDDEFFGMDSHPMRVGSFLLLCQSVIQCETLGSALKQVLKFMRLVLDDIHGTLTINDKFAQMTLHEVSPAPSRAFTYATFLIIVHGLGSWLIGRRIPLLTADFRCEEPRCGADYKIRFSEQARFGQASTCITFNASYLDLPIVQNQRTLVNFLAEAPANLLVKYSNRDSLNAKIRHHLRRTALTEWPDFDTLSRQLHSTSSTLRRKLHQEGQSYQSIKDNLRRDLAINHLSGSRKSIEDIAVQLGFADPSAFHRAFKKWTGNSPGEHRRTLSSK
ncbi:AraC family transcriptional regulator [Glaciimonas sp. PCH181]|uniref:AraC family transcriptional regulator n=1 Tax=Glaciimonas sp. PCH181 TaxID=2133943 RepID=UPI000D3495C2|nr:AraC family transcriptional regulator [Glaciimonas sp. PCH181]PUA16696.1 AraC family transcriptional regulator [Glaciimonas sp. PCH181]